MRNVFYYLLVALLMVVAGCNTVGPRSVKTGRASYNIAVQQTNSEQLLLNIVRLRYRDPPYFLEVSGISTTFDFTASASGSASLPSSESKIYDLGTGISLSEQQPKNTYVAVRYRGNWFSIDDSDLASKSTFSLLMQLLALQAGEIRSTAPVLTLPVGG
jgi:hypothetical protein